MPLKSRPAAWVLVAVAVIFVGLNMRTPIIAVAPVIGDIGADLGLDSAGSGLLTSIPVLCFALATPLASFVIARGGINLAISVTLAGVVLGTVVRSAGDVTAAIAGTIVIGIFITIGNVAVPVVIQSEVPGRHVGIVTGLYTSALNVGSMLASLGTAPLAEALGWRAALVFWVVLAAAAVAAWMIAVGPRAAWRWGATAPGIATGAVEVSAPLSEADGRRRRNRRRMLAVSLTLAFTGQSFAYYGVTAWLPSLLSDEQGYSAAQAGSSSSIFQIAAVVGALGAPLLVRAVGVLPTFALNAALWFTLPLGLIFAPELWLVWSFTGGAAQGAGITIIFMMIVELASNRGQSRRLSALVQGVAYSGASLAPTVVGAAHDVSNGWDLPMFVVVGAVTVFSVFGLVSAAGVGRRVR